MTARDDAILAAATALRTSQTAYAQSLVDFSTAEDNVQLAEADVETKRDTLVAVASEPDGS